MVIENFSHKIISSGVFETFVATGFFGTLIFFVLNSQLFTPLEMMFGTVIVTITLKGISNIMIALVILLFDLKNAEEEQQFKASEDKLDLLLNEMQMKEAQLKTAKAINS